MARLRACLARFARAQEGVATLEFLLLVPLPLMVVFATAELVNAVDHRRRVVQLGRTLADLTAQGDSQSPISTDVMSNIVASAQPILAPFATSGLTMQVSAIGVYVKKKGTTVRVCSTYPASGGSRTVGVASNITVPTNFQTNGARFVLAEVSMPYKPIAGALAPWLVKGLKLNFKWSEAVTWPVRRGITANGDPEIVLPGGAACT